MILNFQSLNFKLDKKLKKFSNKKISKLELFYKKIIDIKVLFKIENSTNSVNKFVEFIVRIPGNNIVVKSTAVSFKESISNNVKSVERILKEKNLILLKIYFFLFEFQFSFHRKIFFNLVFQPNCIIFGHGKIYKPM